MLKIASMPFVLCNALVGLACCTTFINNSHANDELEQVDAYFAAKIWTGEDIIDDGVLLVRDGTILAVGPKSEVQVPVDCARHELGNANLIPGLVVAHSNLVEANRDNEYAVRPEVRSIDGFDVFEDYAKLLAAGITTVQVSSESDRLIPGQGGVVKLAGEDALRRALNQQESLSVVLSRSAFTPSTIYEPPVGAVSVERPLEPTRPQLATSLAQAIVGLRALLSEAQDGDADTADDAMLAALMQLIEKKTTVRWTARSDAEIGAALQLSDEFELPWMIIAPAEVNRLLQVENWDSPSVHGVILDAEIRPGTISNPSLPDSRVPGRMADEELPVWERAARLIAAGAGHKLALRVASDSDLPQIMFVASVLGRAGIEPQQILKMLTINPSAMMGISDRVGSLKEGLDADFVVLSDTPLLSVSRVEATYVDGRKVYSALRGDDSLLIKAGHIVTPEGTLEDGQIAISNGTIRGVAPSVSTGGKTETIDFGKHAYVVPGYVDMSTRLGTGGTLSENIALGTKLGEFLARDDKQIAWARQGGVTTCLLSSTRLPSPVVAFKLGDQPSVVKDPVALRYSLGANLTSAEASMRRTLAAGKAYADSWTKYEADFADYQKKLKAYEAARKEYDAKKKAAEEKPEQDAKDEQPDNEDDSREEKPAENNAKAQGGRRRPADAPETEDKERKESTRKSEDATEESKDAEESKPETPKIEEPKKPDEPKKPKTNENLEPYRALFAKQIAAIVEAQESKAVELAVKLFRTEFDLKTAIVSSDAAVGNANLLADNNVLVIVGPEMVGEQDGEAINYAAELSLAQAAVAFQSSASTGVRELPQAISFAVFKGLGASDAMRSLTKTPSEFLGLNAIGALEPGRDADLVVLSGPPMELSSQVLAVMIDGSWVYEKDEN